MFFKKNSVYLLIAAITSELILPFILGYYMGDFNQITMVISRFGESGIYLKYIFKFWEIINGIFFILGSSFLYDRFKNTSSKYAKVLSYSIMIFAMGDCILTAIFDSTMFNFKSINLGSFIHGYGSAAAFVAITIGILILIYMYNVEGNKLMFIVNIIIFILAGVVMIMFAASKTPFLEISSIKKLAIDYRGIWQKLSLLLTYLPFLIVSVKEITNKKVGVSL